MISRLEIIPGAGTAARFGDVCVWATPQASAALVAFLIDSARNVSGATHGGTRIADHIAGVLESRDPEPGVGFVALGPSERGTTVLLHGPIQAWDGRSWLVPQPNPGWLRTEVAGEQSVAVTAHGAPPPAPAASSDLQAGVVPAAGFALVAGADQAPTTAMGSVEATSVLPVAPVPAGAAAGPPPPPTAAPPAAPPPATPPPSAAPLAPPPDLRPPEPPRSAEPPLPPAPPAGGGMTEAATVIDGDELRQALRQLRERDEPIAEPTTAEPAADPTTAEPAADPTTAEPAAIEPTIAEPTIAEPIIAEPAAVEPPTAEPPGQAPPPDLVEPTTVMAPEPEAAEPEPTVAGPEPTIAEPDGPGLPAGTITFGPGGGRPPLPPVGAPEPAGPGQPVVAGLRCPLGHFNHPATVACVTCGRPVDRSSGQVSGPRPVLGVLLLDDGTVLRLDRSYLLGSAPGDDPTVTGGRARPYTLAADPEVAPIHVEIRLTGWTVSVIDRGSNRPTLVLPPNEQSWDTLRPFITTAVQPGTHIAAGPRVLTMISPWPLGQPLS